jgi:hypothetical protein
MEDECYSFCRVCCHAIRGRIHAVLDCVHVTHSVCSILGLLLHAVEVQAWWIVDVQLLACADVLLTAEGDEAFC